MKKLIIALILSILLVTPVRAQKQNTSSPEITPPRQSTSAATISATIVNPDARAVIQEKKDQDVTETTGGKTDALASHLLEQPTKPLSWHNFLQTWVRQAVSNGLPSNLVVLLILFPIVASVIAFSRHVVGLRGFGIYTPAVLSIALVSTGIPLGIAIFVLIVFVTVLLQKLLKKTNLAHLPKTAIILWGVCLCMVLVLIGTAYLDIKTFFSLSIFPLLILISLSENFTSTQSFSSTKEAIRLTSETLVLAIISALIIDNSLVQQFVIINPEIALLLTLIVDVLIGRYNGLRLMELVRFQQLVKKD